MSWRSCSPSEAGAADAELLDNSAKTSCSSKLAPISAGRGKAERLEPGQRPGRGDGVYVRIVVRLHDNRSPGLQSRGQRPEMLSHWGPRRCAFFRRPGGDIQGCPRASCPRRGRGTWKRDRSCPCISNIPRGRKASWTFGPVSSQPGYRLRAPKSCRSGLAEGGASPNRCRSPGDRSKGRSIRRMRPRPWSGPSAKGRAPTRLHTHNDRGPTRTRA